MRRRLNGFTICFGGAGSCIITCLLVHCLSSSVSQLKQPSVCSYFRKRWHTNQAAAAQFVCLSACMYSTCCTLTTESNLTVCQVPTLSRRASVHKNKPLYKAQSPLKGFQLDYYDFYNCPIVIKSIPYFIEKYAYGAQQSKKPSLR